ncbi:MAG TPA: superoxide dismutase [Candidatus Polarisedimenticolia bacterium]
MHSQLRLPYGLDALVPHVSAETLEYHWGKHHRAYVDALCRLISGTPLVELDIEDLVRRSSGAVFNNAAQHFNHSLYWRSMSPEGGGEPGGTLLEAIERRYGSFGAFRTAFVEQASSHFGSGWAWLVRKPDGSVRIELTHDAGCPIATGDSPLLVCDLWEHAYYIDYRNMRKRYLESYWAVANWRFAESRFDDLLEETARSESGRFAPAP